MEYFAGLDVSMEETHICVVDRDGGMVLETKATTSPEAIAAGLVEGTGVSADRVRDGPHGADAVPRS
jgi:hypothetical protein